MISVTKFGALALLLEAGYSLKAVPVILGLQDGIKTSEDDETTIVERMSSLCIALPENHPRIARDLNSLAGLYCLQGKYEAAEPLFLQAIEICKLSLGEKHPNTKTVLINYLIFFMEKNESKSL